MAVAECRTHDEHFTLYPSGHIPYGRERVAPVAPDGQPLKAQAPAAEGALSATRPARGATELAWAQTRFAAVVDAAQGRAWPRDAPGPYWTTQLERLDELALLLGLESSAPGRELVSRHLGIPELKLRDAARGCQGVAGYRERGDRLLAVLRQVRRGQSLLERILACGAAVGLWGAVHFWRVPGVRGGVPSRQLLPGLGLPDG